jgi:hypothetical protein
MHQNQLQNRKVDYICEMFSPITWEAGDSDKIFKVLWQRSGGLICALPLSTVIPGLVPGTPPSAARAGVWRAGAPLHFTVS